MSVLYSALPGRLLPWRRNTIGVGQIPEVERTLYLFTSIIGDAAGHKLSDDREKYDCRRDLPKELADKFPDPYYTVRAWRAVVTYLLRQREFLYE